MRDTTKTKKILTSLLSFVFTGCSLFGAGSEEQPAYQVILKDNNNEIRKYESYIIAKTIIDGDFKDAQKKGFRILAGYIFGKNKSQQKIAMTSPVIQKQEAVSEKISMTAPVVISPNKELGSNLKQSWGMTFSMPSKYTLETLPQPNDSRVKLERVESRFVAAHTFSGFWNEAKNKSKGKELLKWLEQNKEYKVTSEPMFAGYNPPWTIPFFRRNEILVELESID